MSNSNAVRSAPAPGPGARRLPAYAKASAVRHAGAAAAGRRPRPGPGRSARSPPTTRAHRRRPVAALALARPQLDAPAARPPRRAARSRSRSTTARPGGDAGGARPARAHAARATFFCIAARGAHAIRRCAARSSRRGHSVQNHSDRHAPQLLAARAARLCEREIGTAQDAISRVTGVAPRFFRAPAGLRNPFLAPVLQRLGLRAGELDPARLRHRAARAGAACSRGLTRGLAAGDILLAARRQRRTHARAAVRWCSPCCRRCSSAHAHAGLRADHPAGRLPRRETTMASSAPAA